MTPIVNPFLTLCCSLTVGTEQGRAATHIGARLVRTHSQLPFRVLPHVLLIPETQNQREKSDRNSTENPVGRLEQNIPAWKGPARITEPVPGMEFHPSQSTSRSLSGPPNVVFKQSKTTPTGGSSRGAPSWAGTAPRALQRPAPPPPRAARSRAPHGRTHRQAALLALPPRRRRGPRGLWREADGIIESALGAQHGGHGPGRAGAKRTPWPGGAGRRGEEREAVSPAVRTAPPRRCQQGRAVRRVPAWPSAQQRPALPTLL